MSAPSVSRIAADMAAALRAVACPSSATPRAIVQNRRAETPADWR
jgi:hypothetical protein